MKNLQKGFAIPIIIAIGALLVLGGGYFLFLNKKPETNNENINSSKVQQQTNTQQVVTKDKSQTSSDGTITISAKKIQTTVDVQVKENGNLINSFTYEEIVSADNSGNAWTALPPSIALSPDGKKIAYSDTMGLKVIHIETKDVKTLRYHDMDTDSGGYPKPSVYLKPAWSNDSRFILYSIMIYEGSNNGIYDLNTSQFNDSVLEIVPAKLEMIFVNDENYFIYFTNNFGSDYGGQLGLFVAQIKNVEDIKFKTVIDTKETNTAIWNFKQLNDLEIVYDYSAFEPYEAEPVIKSAKIDLKNYLDD